MNPEKFLAIVEKHKYMFSEMYKSQRRLKLHSMLRERFRKANEKGDKARIEDLMKKQNKVGSYYPIAHGLECDEGWLDLIDELMTKLESLDIRKEIKIHQIKEKLGGLRFYVSGSMRMDVLGQGSLEFHDQEGSDWEKIHETIHEYEDKSYEVCEVCGKPAKLCVTKGRWLKTVCKEHRIYKLTDGVQQFYEPVQAFSIEAEVLHNKEVRTVVKARFDTEADTWFYKLDNEAEVSQDNLQRKPRQRFHKDWAVKSKRFPGLEFIITKCTFDPENGWMYTIEADETILMNPIQTEKEENLEYILNKND